CVVSFEFVFFSSRRRHTRFKCDWSSDVCSSDLVAGDAEIALRCHRDDGKGLVDFEQIDVLDAPADFVEQLPDRGDRRRREPLRRSEEHTSELQSHLNLVCRLLLEKKKKKTEILT